MEVIPGGAGLQLAKLAQMAILLSDTYIIYPTTRVN